MDTQLGQIRHRKDNIRPVLNGGYKPLPQPGLGNRELYECKVVEVYGAPSRHAVNLVAVFSVGQRSHICILTLRTIDCIPAAMLHP